MAFYNVQSLFIFFGILSLIGGGVALFYIRHLDTSSRYWLAASLILGVTNIATIFRAELPLFWVYSVSIALSCSTYLLMGLGILHLLGRRKQSTDLMWVTVLTITYVVLIEWARVNMPAQVALVISSLGLGLSSLWCWHPAHQHYKLTRNPFSRHMRWLVVVLAFTQFLRIQGAFTDWTLESFGKNAISLSIWSAIYVMGILRYCFYIGMRLHESAQKQILAATHQARMEENIKLNGQMAHLERQHSLGVMAASFSHELNQPLTVIVNYADLGKHRLSTASPDSKELGELMDRIIESTMRMSQVIQRIRSFIQPAAMQTEEVHLKPVLQEVIALVENEALKKNVQLFLHVDEKKLSVQADSIHLSQVFLNVIRNAMEAATEGLRREVHVRLAQQNDKAVVLVQDTGPGLSAEAEKMAGTPFFTTKSQGLGMGLSISTRILSQYDGTLTLKSTPTAGTTVSIVLPVSTFKNRVA